MKHKKEWRTCDRCGTEIKRPEIWYTRLSPYFRIINLKTPMSYKEICTEIEQGGIKPIISEKGIQNIMLTECYCKKSKQIDLCSECRKDFVRFMKNEKID